MAHLGWILGVAGTVGGYFGGILTGLFGHAVKYSFDKGSELKELIIKKIKREIEELKAPPTSIVIQSWKGGPAVSLSDWQVRSNPNFSQYALDLKTGTQLIGCYFVIRHFVGLPRKKNLAEAAKLLPQLSQIEKDRYQEALYTAEKVMDLLKYSLF